MHECSSVNEWYFKFSILTSREKLIEKQYFNEKKQKRCIIMELQGLIKIVVKFKAGEILCTFVSCTFDNDIQNCTIL